MTEQNRADISQVELNLLLFFYTFAKQDGHVDMEAARKWALEKFGMILPNKPFRIEQSHLDLLTEHKLIPDTRELFAKLRLTRQ